MIASDLSEVTWGVAAVVLIAGLGALIARNKIDMVRLKAGPIEASVDMASIHQELKKVTETVKRIDDSTNHRREGEGTLADTAKDTKARVEVIEEEIKVMKRHQDHERRVLLWQNDMLARLVHHTGLPHTDPPVEETS